MALLALFLEHAIDDAPVAAGEIDYDPDADLGAIIHVQVGKQRPVWVPGFTLYAKGKPMATYVPSWMLTQCFVASNSDIIAATLGFGNLLDARSSA